jgi:hypothetical protein
LLKHKLKRIRSKKLKLQAEKFCLKSRLTKMYTTFKRNRVERKARRLDPIHERIQ